MTTTTLDRVHPALEKLGGFSLLTGGPIHRLYLRLGLAAAPLRQIPRRTAVAITLNWVALVAIVGAEELARTHPLEAFVRDLEVHVRFLIVIPLLIAGEALTDQRLRESLPQFNDRQLIPPEEEAHIDAVLTRAARMRDSVWAETVLLALVVVFSASVFQERVALKAARWFGEEARVGMPLSALWYAGISMPLFQILFFRWYYRLLIWCTLLWRLAGIRLRLLPTHPDHAGGIAFLGQSLFAFAPFILAHSTLLSAMIADRLFRGATLMDFRMLLGAAFALIVGFLVLPLLRFIPQLAQCRKRGLLEYGALSTRCMAEFDEKWRQPHACDDSLLASGNVSSVSDMASSYELVRAMNIVPFDRSTIVGLVVLLCLPLLPLALTLISAKEILSFGMKLIL